MNIIVLTQSTTPILGPIAKILGLIMEGIFNVLDLIGMPNIGLSIILFTIVIYLLMLPLTIKQQKFSKLSAKMNPELQAVSAKYKNKKDNDSMMKMNAETQAVYAKYGVSPTGSCVQLLIQMPILLSLYRVINNMPAYVDKIKSAFDPLVDNLIGTEGGIEFVQNLKSAAMYKGQFTNEAFVNGTGEYVKNTLIDVLNRASTTDLAEIATQFPLLATDVEKTAGILEKYNNFLFLNMGNSPSFMVNEAIAKGAWIMVVVAFIIPVLSAVTQWINVKLMPQQPTANTGNDQMSSMASSMKTMNMMMPIMSAFFCYSLPAGMGLYWIAGSVVRSVQQVIINKHIDKMDLNELIDKNKEKSAKKMAKVEARQKKYAGYAAVNTKNISSRASVPDTVSEDKKTHNPSPSEKSNGGKSGSLLSRANMVKDYNERNNRSN